MRYRSTLTADAVDSEYNLKKGGSIMIKRDIVINAVVGVVISVIFMWIVASVVHYPATGYLAEWSFWNLFAI